MEEEKSATNNTAYELENEEFYSRNIELLQQIKLSQGLIKSKE